MKLSEMKQVLATGQIQLTKSLGQSFLHDGNQLQRIANAAELVEADQVLEIGPGLGPLTDLLLARVHKVLAIEKDRRLYEWLKNRYQTNSRLTLLNADALEYLREHPFDWTGWKLVANLPYSVASSLLVELVQGPDPPGRIVVTLQKEVAQRLMASAGQTGYGVLTLLIQLQCEPLSWFKIPASCFFPAPEVDSACITLVRRSKPLMHRNLGRVFEILVKKSFSQRRKMMMKLLKESWAPDKLEDAFRQVHLSPRIRAEEVTLEQFVQLAQLLQLQAQECP